MSDKQPSLSEKDVGAKIPQGDEQKAVANTPPQAENDRNADNIFRDEHKDEIIFVKKPEIGAGAAREGYYFAENVEIMIHGVVYPFDIYFVESQVIAQGSFTQKVNPYNQTLREAGYSNFTEKQLLDEGFVQYDRIVTNIRYGLGRLEKSGEKDTETKEAYELFRRGAIEGKRMAFVDSHGDSLTDDDGHTSWVLQSHDPSGHSSPDAVVQDLLSKKNDADLPQYGLVYLLGCNPDNAHVSKGEYTQPVIVHTKDNEVTSAPAKII